MIIKIKRKKLNEIIQTGSSLTLVRKHDLHYSNTIKYNSTTTRFRYYSNGSDIQLYKLKESSAAIAYAEEFLSSKLILKSHVSKLAKGEKVRNTFVMWLEGEDPECVGNEPPVDSALVLGVDISAHASEKNY